MLQIRKEQLELAIEMGEWTDAHKTSNNIYQLMSKVSSKKTDQEIKQLYIEFFNHLSKIFWESKLYIFHAYALYNIQYLTKSLKNVTAAQKLSINDQLVLAVMSIPLNERVSNFERLPFIFTPEFTKGGDDRQSSARDEILSIARILQVEGLPSRSSLIQIV